MKYYFVTFLMITLNISYGQEFNDLKEYGWNGNVKKIVIKRYKIDKLTKKKEINNVKDWSQLQIYFFNKNSNIDSIYTYNKLNNSKTLSISIYKYSIDKRDIEVFQNKVLKSNIVEKFTNQYEIFSIEKNTTDELEINSSISLNRNMRTSSNKIKGFNKNKELIINEEDVFFIDSNNLCYKSEYKDFIENNSITYLHEYFSFDKKNNFLKSIKYKLEKKEKALEQITLREITYY